MDDFERSLRETETPDGPFRTAEPSPEVRLHRAREASWARVAEATREAMAAEERTRRRWDRLAWALFALSVLGLAALIAVVALTPLRVGALVCPAVAAVLASLLGVAHRVRLGRRAGRPVE